MKVLTGALCAASFFAITSESNAYTFNTAPAIASRASGLLSVYAARTTGFKALEKTDWNGSSWSSWYTPNVGNGPRTPFNNTEVAAIWYGPSDARKEAICINEGGLVCSVQGSYVNGNWETLTFNMLGSPALAATTNADGSQTLRAYMLSAPGDLRIGTHNGRAFNGFAYAEGEPSDLTTISAAANGEYTYLCGQRSSGGTWCTYTNNLPSTGTWTQATGAWGSSRPAIALNNQWGLHFFAQTSFDQQIWRSWWLFGWNDTNPLPGAALNSAPSAVSWGGDTIHVVARGTDGNIWLTYYDQGNWAPAWYAF
jgi:hypothetical protein